MVGTKPLHVEVRVRNNNLLSRRKEYGFNQKQMAVAIGVGFGAYAGLENLRTSPLTPDGDVSRAAKEIMNFFDCEFKDLWPDLLLRVKNCLITREMDVSEVMALLSAAPPEPDKALEQKRRMEWTADALESLPERQRLLVERSAEDIPRSETAGELGISAERARQIEARAMRRLQIAVRGDDSPLSQTMSSVLTYLSDKWQLYLSRSTHPFARRGEIMAHVQRKDLLDIALSRLVEDESIVKVGKDKYARRHWEKIYNLPDCWSLRD